MMLLKSVSIAGLWGVRKLNAQFFPDANFLIGPNGSGKTTVINLVAAVLTADWSTLNRVSFERIQLKLIDNDTHQECAIGVNKEFDPRRRLFDLTYVFEDQKGQREYSEEDIDRHVARRYPGRRMHGAVIEELGNLVKVQWLSIHRSPSQTPDEDDDSYESTVDQKLDELGGELIKFFSKIASAGEAESERFQKTVFTSLLYVETTQWDLIKSVDSLNLEQEKAALYEIFRKFRVPEWQYSEQLKEHFDLVSAALLSSSVSTPHLIALVSMRSIHQVVTHWQETLERQQEISKPKEQFLSLLNRMMEPRKNFSVNEKNQLQVSIGNRVIDPTELSSGEKQMLILLGEALLQEREHWIYIADEPELSLHVKWQETLTDNLRQINPNAQIIFATHSPDIVGPHEDRVLNTEDLLN